MGDQQNKQGGDKSTSPDRGSSNQPQTDKKIPSGGSDEDGMSGSGGRRGSTANPSNPYDTTKGGDRSKSGDPGSEGGSTGSSGKGDTTKR